jgi:hypothetical protein
MWAATEMLGELVAGDLEAPAHHAVAAATASTVTICGIMRLADPWGETAIAASPRGMPPRGV